MDTDQMITEDSEGWRQAVLENLIEEAYNERVKYDFIMAAIKMRTSTEIPLEIHASNFAKDIEQLQSFKAKALGALTHRGLLSQATTPV